MKLITLDQARDHVKSDGDDDELLTVYCNAAEAACARLANRNLYKTTADLTAAVALISDKMVAAYAAYDAAVTAADAQDDDRMVVHAKLAAQAALRRVIDEQEAVMHGLALDAAADESGSPIADDIISAILLTVGHYYRNRESVTTGQGAAALEVPMTVQHIMSSYHWIGSQL